MDFFPFFFFFFFEGRKEQRKEGRMDGSRFRDGYYIMYVVAGLGVCKLMGGGF